MRWRISRLSSGRRSCRGSVVVADVALERHPETGKLMYREVRLTVPRQSGKTTMLLALILTRALGAPDQDIRYTAQSGLDARKKWFDDWLPALSSSRFENFYKPRLANGHEALRFRNGSIQGSCCDDEAVGARKHDRLGDSG